MNQPVGILAAMDVEVSAILNLCERYTLTKTHGIPFFQTTIENHDVIIGLCGIGKVSAAARTMLMVESFHPSCIINIGTAGGLRADQKVLDVVLADSICQYDIDVHDWGFGYGNAHTCFKIDMDLLEKAKAVINDQNHHVWIGPIATGDAFVNRDDQVEMILQRYPESLCAEMEGGAIAQVCNMVQTPVLVIRSLSDITVTEGNEMTFDQYAELASQRAARWCYDLIKTIE